MSQLTRTELLFQLKSFTCHPPTSISENLELRNQLYYAAQEAMVSFEDHPDPISRVAVAQVYLLWTSIPPNGNPTLKDSATRMGSNAYKL